MIIRRGGERSSPHSTAVSELNDPGIGGAADGRP